MSFQQPTNNQCNQESGGIHPAPNQIHSIEQILEFHRKRVIRYLGVRIILTEKIKLKLLFRFKTCCFCKCNFYINSRKK